MSETPDNALTTRMHGDYRLSIDRFFVGINEICSTFLRNNPICIEGRNCRLNTVLGYSINARAVGPRTPYRVGGLAGEFTRAWVSHSLVNHWIYNVTTQYSYYIKHYSNPKQFKTPQQINFVQILLVLNSVVDLMHLE